MAKKNKAKQDAAMAAHSLEDIKISSPLNGQGIIQIPGSRATLTPSIVIHEMLSDLASIYDAELLRTDGPNQVAKMAKEVWQETVLEDDDKLQEQLLAGIKKDKKNGLLYILRFCIAKVMIVAKVDAAGHREQAWIRSLIATRIIYEVKIQHLSPGKPRLNQEEQISKFMGLLGALGASARHAEHKDLEKTAIDYYLKHRSEFRSKEDAAEKIAGKIVPLKFRTVRGYLAGLPPAGKP